MMSYAWELPMYWRARLEVFREAIAQAQNDDPDIALLRNGVMRNKASEEMQSEARMKEKEFPNSPLSLVEICSFNTWFAQHPEKVCGEEIITTSREFPISIKGDRTWIENTIGHSIGEDRLILPVPFEWTIKYFDATDPDFDAEYTNGEYNARIYQGGVDFNLQIHKGDYIEDNVNFKDIRDANLHLMNFMKSHRGKESSKTLELEALALEIELQMTEL
jgi:hypothetical protein